MKNARVWWPGILWHNTASFMPLAHLLDISVWLPPCLHYMTMVKNNLSSTAELPVGWAHHPPVIFHDVTFTFLSIITLFPPPPSVFPCCPLSLLRTGLSIGRKESIEICKQCYTYLGNRIVQNTCMNYKAVGLRKVPQRQWLFLSVIIYHYCTDTHSNLISWSRRG